MSFLSFFFLILSLDFFIQISQVAFGTTTSNGPVRQLSRDLILNSGYTRSRVRRF
jgi:hypothetical protein